MEQAKPGLSQAAGKQAALFLALAYGLPLPFVALMRTVPAFAAGAPYLLAFGAAATAPTLAAILTVLLSRGVCGLKPFLRERYSLPANHVALLIALAFPVAITGASRLLTVWLTGEPFPLGAISPTRAIILCWALVAEELGWRGFLQPLWQPRLNRVTLSVVMGVVWALWHYHFWLMSGISVPVWLFILGCVADSSLYLALGDLAGKSVWPASLYHFMSNVCIAVFLLQPADNRGRILPYVLMTGLALLTGITANLLTGRKKPAKNREASH